MAQRAPRDRERERGLDAPAADRGDLPPRFPHERPPALDLGGVSESPRAILRAHVAELFRLHYDTINELREIAERCKADEDRFNHISALRTLGQLTGKNIELAVGRTMTLNMQLRSQEDLVDWATLPAEVQQKASEALDAAVAAGVDFGSPLRGLPTMGEATRVWEGDRPPRGTA